jgi:L,D-transpeptidase-like protein
MPGNPIECRLYALRCSQLAKAAATLESRRVLLALAGTWKGLAVELESDQVFLQTISELEFSSQCSEPCLGRSDAATFKHAAPESSPPAAPKVLVVIDKPTQEMNVFVDSVERYTWEVSTGLRGCDMPSGKYTARSMNEIWYSKQWDDAPMPHAIFFTKKGHAVHGTNETKNLSKPASHGCVRLAPENARTCLHW